MLVFLVSRVSVAEILVQDAFEYDAPRQGTGADIMQAPAGPWTRVKANNMTGSPYACGYLYTTTTIPGYSGPFPGVNSNRVLCSEHLPSTLDCDQGAPGACAGGRWLQSDTYFGYGASGSRALPADLWIQFWMYPQHHVSQPSRFYRGKFLYACGEDTFFSTCPNGGMDWLGIFKDDQSYATFFETAQTDGNLYYAITTAGHATYDDGINEPAVELGHNQTAGGGVFLANTWYLVKMNYNMTNPTTPMFRMWVRTPGETQWTTYANYVGGTTNHLTWQAAYPNGQYWMSILQMNDCYDMWMYFDDFVIADAETDLPTYGLADQTAPAPPTALLVW